MNFFDITLKGPSLLAAEMKRSISKCKHLFRNKVFCHILEDNIDSGDVRSIMHKNGQENKKNTVKNHKSIFSEFL